MDKPWTRRPRKPDSQLGPLVRDARERRGLTQHQLGNLVGVQGSVISKIESGVTKQPSPHILLPVLEVLGIDAAVAYQAATGHTPSTLPELPGDVLTFATWLARFEPEQRHKLQQAVADMARTLGFEPHDPASPDGAVGAGRNGAGQGARGRH